MNRREFLRSLLATAAAAQAAGIVLVRTDDSLYFNDLYGLGLTKPKQWYFHSVAHFTELSHTIENEISYEELEALFSGAYVDPFIVMSSGIDIVIDFEPMIYIHAEIVDSEPPGFDLIHKKIVDIHTEAMKEFEIVDEFNVKERLGFPSSFHVASFAHVRKERLSIKARYKMLMIKRGNILYTINSIDAPISGVNTDREFESIISSIEFI